MEERSAVLKPAVRVVTDWNKDKDPFSGRDILKFQYEDSRDKDQCQRVGEDDLTLHPVSGNMVPVSVNIIPGQETDSADHDKQDDHEIDQRVICVGCQGGICSRTPSRSIPALQNADTEWEYKDIQSPGKDQIAAEYRCHQESADQFDTESDSYNKTGQADNS